MKVFLLVLPKATNNYPAASFRKKGIGNFKLTKHIRVVSRETIAVREHDQGRGGAGLNKSLRNVHFRRRYLEEGFLIPFRNPQAPWHFTTTDIRNNRSLLFIFKTIFIISCIGFDPYARRRLCINHQLLAAGI